MTYTTILYRAWKGENDDSRIFFSVSEDEGTTWSPQHDVVGLTSGGPTLGYFESGPSPTSDEAIYRSWKGVPGDSRIWISSKDGSEGGGWEPQFDVVGLTSDTPALSAGPGARRTSSPFGPIEQNAMYRAWKGEGGDQRIFMSSTIDGKNWTPEYEVSGLTSAGPSLAFQNGLFRAWKGVEGDARLFLSISRDGEVWPVEHQIPGNSSHAPTLTVGPAGRVHMVWKGVAGDSRMFISSTENGFDWTPEVPIPGLTSERPTLAGGAESLYRLWKGLENDPRMFFSASRDGNTWSPEIPIEGLTSHGPSLLAVSHEIIR